MPIQRRLSWNAALRDMRCDRARVAAGVVSARSLILGLTCIHRISLISPDGTFNRAALMAIAVQAATAHQLRTGAAWSISMSVGLTAAWQAAKAARKISSDAETKAYRARTKGCAPWRVPALESGGGGGEGRAVHQPITAVF